MYRLESSWSHNQGENSFGHLEGEKHPTLRMQILVAYNINCAEMTERMLKRSPVTDRHDPVASSLLVIDALRNRPALVAASNASEKWMVTTLPDTRPHMGYWATSSSTRKLVADKEEYC